ncbi:putative C2H2 finger domain protein [Aspergillus undulatus]|uniref:putative C2H2 finger domain protein n=1 Tax=Aspergillus undulatus TaxID=1810928 RepID=UPI003CCD6C89
MSGLNNAWDHTSDVLQGISSAPQAELSPHGHHPDLTPSDPASFLGFQIGPDPNVVSHSHTSFLNQWPPPKQSTSPTPQLEYAHYSSARFMSNQDSWNPLQVTGVPANVTFSMRPLGRVPQMGMGMGMGVLDRRCSDGHPSTYTSSETGETTSQYNGLHSSDSGYSSRSCTTRSIATSYAVDSACSPFAQQDCEQDEKPARIDLGSAHQGEVLDLAERTESPAPSLICHDVIKCDYPGCSWVGKCPSDKRKHEARHRKLFKCDEPNCTRKEGFGTINDLARHKKCVHKKEPERGPKILYMSHEWYQNCVKAHGITSVATDNMPDMTSSQAQQIFEPDTVIPDADHEFRDQFAPIHTSFQPSNILMPENIKRLDEDHDLGPTPPQPMELSELSTLNLEPALEQKVCPSQFVNQRHDKMDDMISEAAHSVINAMTKMINNHQRRRGHFGEDDPADEEGELSDRNREILQKILSTASGLLAESPGNGNGNGNRNSTPYENANAGTSTGSDWIQCEFCSKQTRLRCEMKKHQKRHERPYGCTFSKCYKTFGSKADWKHHEQSQHFGVQGWHCTLPIPTSTTRSRGPDQTHKISDNKEIQISICKDQLGWKGEPQFWCGFCQGIVHLRGNRLTAWNQRFDHIDRDHFKTGERVEDWYFPEGFGMKGRELENIQGMSIVGEVNWQDHEGKPGNNNYGAESGSELADGSYLDRRHTILKNGESESLSAMSVNQGSRLEARPQPHSQYLHTHTGPSQIHSEQPKSRKRKLRSVIEAASGSAPLAPRPSPFIKTATAMEKMETRLRPRTHAPALNLKHLARHQRWH